MLRRKMRQGRACAVQGLEARQLLAASLQVFDGSSELMNGSSDSFGSVTVGSTDAQSWTLQNVGDQTLTVDSDSLPYGFSSPTALPLSIDPGQSATFDVSLDTSSMGSYGGQLDLSTNDPNNNPFMLNLSGTVQQSGGGGGGGGSMELLDGTTYISNGGSDSLGTWSVGDTASKTFTVDNNGTGSLTVSALSLPGGFSSSTALPLSIAAGGSGTFVVSMNTATATSYSGTMSITDDDSYNDPYNVTLSGAVTFPTVTIAATGATADELTGAAGQFTVSRTGATDEALTADYMVSGSAVPGVDYSALSGTVTIPAGSGSSTISVNPLTGGKINVVQQIVLPAPTGGTYTLSIGSDTTAALAYSANAAAVAAALGALPSVGAGRVSVIGSGTSADPFVVTFDGPLGGPDPAQIVGDGSQLTGGTSTTITTSITTPGDVGGTVVATLASSANYNVGTPSQDTVNVLGDEPPVVTVVATTPTADEVAGTSGMFTLYRNGPTTNSLTVSYSLGGSTLDGVDYAWIPGNVTFAAGQSTTQVTIAPTNNGLAGPAKTAVLTLSVPTGSNPPYALAGATSDTVTISDSNLPEVSVFATSPTANEETQTAGEFTVTRNGDTTDPLTVSFTVGGTAVSGTDYQPIATSVTIPAGAASATVDVTPIEDGGTGTSSASTVVLTLAGSSSYQFGSNSSDTVTIDDDDDLPQLSIVASTPIAVESSSTSGDFTISIDTAQASDLTIPYTVSGTAVSGTDYTALSGTATIPAGQTSVIVPVTPLNDPNEYGFTTVQATLSGGSGYQLTASKTAVVSIEGNMSVPTLTLVATAPTANVVTSSDGVFTVTRSGSTADPLTAYYAIAGSAVNGTDYGLLPGNVTIPAGQTSTTIVVSPSNDTAMEDSSRTVVLNLTNYGGPDGASYAIGNPAGDTVTIDDLPTVSIQATTGTAQEHELAPGTFTVTRADDPLQATQALTVSFTVGGTAASGTDFRFSGTGVTVGQSPSTVSVSIPAGSSSATIGVTPIDAGLVGGSQTVTLTLASGNYLAGTGSSDTVTINDDDLPTITLLATTPTASEISGSPGVFTVTRNGPTTNSLTLPYSVSGTGVPGTNYQTLSGSVTIPAGSASATIDVTPDNINEIGGTFTVIASLTAGSAYLLGSPASDTVTILENDLPTVMLTATQPHATESGTTGTFTVTRNGTVTSPLTVLYTVAGTAAMNSDYQPLAGYVTIPAGQSSATITVTPINDPLVEQDQTVVLTLASTSQYLAGSDYTDTVTIYDDNTPSVTVAATANANEANSTAGTFSVSRLGPTDSALTVSYTVTGAAQSGTDYQSIGSSITIPAGQSSATIDVTPLLDKTAETQQIVIPSATGGTFTLSVTSPSGTAGATAPGAPPSPPTTNTTEALPYNATASQVQTALELLPEVGHANVLVSGQGTSASPFVVQFLGGLVGVNMPQITADDSQLTGTVSASVTTTTAGQTGTNQVEQVGFTAASGITGGTFTLYYNSNSTSALAYNADAATVQAALEALPGIGSGNVAVSTLQTGPDTYTWQLTFQGTLAMQSLPQVMTNPTAITVTSGSASADDSILTTGSMGGGVNAVQQVTVTGAVGGTFTLSYGGATTAPIGYNAAAADVASALEALSTIGMNNVAVSGNAGGPWSVTFQAALGDQPIADMTIDGSGLTVPPISTNLTAWADGQRTVVVTLASSTSYTVGTLSPATASGGTGASDTVTITDPGNNIAPTIQSTQWSTQIDQTLSVAAGGVLAGAKDPNANATITAVLLTGVAHGSLTLNADGSFTYAPAAGYQGSDSFVYQGFDGTTYSVPATATISVVPAPAPQISVSEDGTNLANGGSDDFGQTWVGTPLTQTFTITNTGTADLTLSSWTAPAGFTIVTAPAADVAAGGSTTMTVQLDATTAGSYSGAFSLDDNVTGESPYTFTLSGTVNNLAPVLEVLQGSTVLANGSTSGYSFGTIGQGEPSTDVFTIENTGTANLTLSDPINLPAGFSLSADFGATTLAPGATTTFAVELTAAAAGSYSGNLSFTTNDANNATCTLPLSGTVVATPIVAVLDGTTTIANGAGQDSFGMALVGTALTKTFTIDNNGSATLSLDPTQLVLPTGFSVVTPYATSVAPGSSTTLTIEIDGAMAGDFSGTLSFPTNDVGQPTYSFHVSGEIDTPEPGVEVFYGATQIMPGTGTVDFGTTAVGTPVDETLTIENVGTADLTVPSSLLLPSGYRLVSVSANDLAPEASATMTLELLGDFAGTYSGVASLYTNDPTEQPFAFNLTGVVDAPQAQLTLAGTAVADQTGSVDFGATSLNTPVQETFSVTNSGMAPLVLTDPIEVPYGFSVSSDFAATTLAPGASTTFVVQLDAVAAGTYQGSVAFQTNDPNQALYNFAVKGQAGMPVIQVADGTTTLANNGSDEFGETPLGTPVQQTFTVANTGNGVLTLDDPISLPAGFSLVSDFGSTSLNPGASTTFTVELTASATGLYSGDLSFDTNGTTLGTYDLVISGGVAAPRLDLLEGTTDVTSYAVTGSAATAQALDFGSTVLGTPRSETFTVENTGTTNLTLSDPLSLPMGFTLTQDFASTTLSPGASTTFSVELTAAAAGDPSGNITFGTNLPLPPGEGGGGGSSGNSNPPPGTSGPTFSLPVQGEVFGLTNLWLWNDTGYSSSDGVSSDPTVAGNLIGVPDGKTAEVQFGVVAAGATTPAAVAGSEQASTGQPFTFPMPGLVPGPVTIAARVHLVDAVLGDLYTSWTPLSFTLETGTAAAPVVTNLALGTVTVPTASTPTSSDSTITGSVLNDGNVADLTIQIDTTGSGMADDTATTDANGNFLYTPLGLLPGTYTYNFRAVENAYPSGEIDGPWEPFTFTIVAPNPPVVDTLSLANVTGPGADTTTDPTLTGHVTADGNPQQVEVDFDYNGDGMVDATTLANADGTFTFTPAGLPLGNVTIEVRAVNLDQDLTGAWTSLSFTLVAPQAPTVSTLKLLNDTGSSSTDNVTDDPTVTGTLTDGVGVAGVTVQFDTNGNGMPDGSTVSDSNGNFTWTPTGLQPGPVTIAARAVTTDPATGNTLIGNWVSLTFTYDTTAGPQVSSLSLAHPTCTDATSGDPTAVNATLMGTLTNGGALASFLTVQYEIGSDTTPDGSTTTDAQGNFTFTPTGLAAGTNTVEVRGVMQDPQTGQDVDGPWTSITFILEQDPVNQPPATAADASALATNDQVAATSFQADQQAVDNGIQDLNGAMGASSTPAGQISVGVGTYSALWGMVGGRVVSGSVFDVQNGSLPAPPGVGAGSGDTLPSSGGSTTTGPSLPASSPAALPNGTPLTLEANLTTPTAGSGMITNQAISSNGTLGPGSADLTGTLNGSWSITVSTDPNNSNITDWTITVSLAETFDNSLSGSFTDTSGATTLTHDYTDDVPGNYNFTFQASGTSTQTAGGTIVAGTYTLLEGNSYSYSFSDSPVATASSTGSISTTNESLSASGSHGFTHVETGGSFSSGGGLPPSSGTAAASSGPTVSSTLILNEVETLQSTAGTSGSSSASSADGTDTAGTVGNDVFNYASQDFGSGGYTASGAAWSDYVNFNNQFSESDANTQTTTDNFQSAVANGQIDGGGQTTVLISSTVNNSASGEWTATPTTYTLDPSFDVQQSQNTSDQIDEAGNMSGNSDDVATTGSFSFHETDSANSSDGQQGTDSAAGTNFTANGTFNESNNANDQETYHDGGSYSGTVQPSADSSDPSAPPPGAEAVSGSFNDSASQSDSASESATGTFTVNNSDETQQGNEIDTASSSASFSSSGSDSASSSSDSAGDHYTNTSTNSGSYSNSASFSDSPTLDSASGSLSTTATASDIQTASDNGHSTSGSLSWNDSISASDTSSMQDSGTYTASNAPSTGSFSDEFKGTGSRTTSATESDSWSETGTVTGSDSYYFNEGGYDTAIASASENDTFDNTQSSASVSGTFSHVNYDSASAYYNDFGTSKGSADTNTYTDNDQISETATYSNSGTVSPSLIAGSTVNDTSASYSSSDSRVEVDIGTAIGTYSLDGMSGGFFAMGSDDSTSTTSDSGTYNQGTSYSGSDSYSQSDSTHETKLQTDAGFFYGGPTGTYSDGKISDDTDTAWRSGTTTTTGNSSSTSGSYTTDSRGIDGDYTFENKQLGLVASGGWAFGFNSSSYHDNGNFTASSGSQTDSASFTYSDTSLDTDSIYDNGTNGASTWTSQKTDAGLTIDTANGSYSKVPTGFSAAGTATGDILEVGTDSKSHTKPKEPGGTHSDWASGADMRQAHADGDFANKNGAVDTTGVQYYDNDWKLELSRSSDSTDDPTASGGSQSWWDSMSSSESSTHHDSGLRKMTDSGPIDNGSGTDYKHESATYTSQTIISFLGGGSTSTYTAGKIGDDYTTGSYSLSGAGETYSDSFFKEDRPSASTSYTGSYTAPGDPGTYWNSDTFASGWSDEVDTGTFTNVPSVSGSTTITSAMTDYFTHITSRQGSQSYQTASHEEGDGSDEESDGGDEGGDSGDKGGEGPGHVGESVYVGDVPSPGYNRLLLPWSEWWPDFVAAGSAPSVTTSSSESAADHSNKTSIESSQGTLTTQNDTTNTAETYYNYDSSSYSGTKSNTSTSSYSSPNSSGDWTSMGSQTAIASETESHAGSLAGGVTSDFYNKYGGETDTTSYSTADDSSATDSSGDSFEGSGATSYYGQDVRSLNETGSYTTNPPGTQQPMPTTDNPKNYATSSQTIIYDESENDNEGQQAADAESGGNFYVTVSGSYTTTASVSIHSNSTVSVNVVQNVDTQSGNYTADGSEWQSASYSVSGHVSNPPPSEIAAESWTQQIQETHSGYSNNTGTYGGQNTDVQGSDSTDSESDLQIDFYRDPWTGAIYGPFIQAHSGGGGGGGTWTTTGDAPKAPVDEDTTVDLSTEPPDLKPVKPDDLKADEAATSAVENADTDTTKSVTNLADTPEKIDGLAGDEPSQDASPVQSQILQPLVTRIFQGSDREKLIQGGSLSPFDFVSAIPLKGDAAAIAKVQLDRLWESKDMLKGSDNFKLALVTWSDNADKAIQVANNIVALLSSSTQEDVKFKVLLTKLEFHLVTLDADASVLDKPAWGKLSLKALMPQTDEIVKDWHQYYQNRETGSKLLGELDEKINDMLMDAEAPETEGESPEEMTPEDLKQESLSELAKAEGSHPDWDWLKESEVAKLIWENDLP